LADVPTRLVGKNVRCSRCRKVFIPTEAPALVEAVDDPPDGARADVGFCCPFCNTRREPLVVSKVATGGWVLFCVMLVVCLPLCLLGLLVRDHYPVCSRCGANVG
jgi:hypothetical protein